MPAAMSALLSAAPAAPMPAAMSAPPAALPARPSLQVVSREAVSRQGMPPKVTRPKAVLFDRDGTLVVDVPYNGDPSKVQPMPGAAEAVDRLRTAGIPVGVVSNQSGIGRGLLTPKQVEAVNDRVELLLGPFAAWETCPHDEDAGCACRKPAPGLILRAAELIGVEPAACAVVGDIGSDMRAAAAAGALGVMVPTPATRPDEVAAAPLVAPDLLSAIELLLDLSAIEPLLDGSSDEAEPGRLGDGSSAAWNAGQAALAAEGFPGVR